RVMDRFDDLRDLYFNSLKKGLPLDTIRYTDSNSASSIVSSMDFSRDNRYFAVGGVTKEIKVFDSNLIHPTFNMDDDEETVIHCPIQTMSSKHKISCVCWNPYVQSQLASSDYGGNVSIWDASTGLCVRTFQEHKQRAWSVDISRTNPDIMASASDDATVKIWSMNQSRSIYTFTEKSNVCSVHFGPHDHHQLMVGSADSNIRWYDTRWTRDALLTLKGHNKTVSYIKWLNNTELVSLSIDGSLKLWDLSNKECKRTYTGHTNRRNFVGLSVEGDWFSCGSEDNAVYTYHKYSAKPSLIYKFPSDDDSLGESSTAFGSSVCWKRNSNILLAANSKGMIQALSLE
ncbi:WD40-repeat-containing domain protein, partial [Radiomyces spectabilis]|uniref:WD40-repeat-containing domain protein n=1 Tax=Radiomyces spectabilis TaxID=64574 RepID=UPI00221FBBE0